MDRQYTKAQLEELKGMKAAIMHPCKECGGLGYLDDDDQTVCDCLKLFRYLKELYYSNIPSEYWTLTLESLKIDGDYKGEIKDYITHLDTACRKGLGLMFSGPQRGIGKTSSMCMIGKEAVIRGYQPFYVIAQNIIDDKFSKEKQILERIAHCDILLIDELDKIVMANESNIPKQLENLLRGILPNKKSIIIATNFTPEEIEETFKIGSLLDRYIKIIDMEGQDYSKKLKDK